MTESWMEQLMERTIAKGQTVDDLLRRSAGIPAAFIALFLSEPEGMPKKLLPRALRWLIDVANMSLHNLHEDDNYHKDLLQDSTDSQPPRTVKEAHANEKASKVRDEGVIPTVHAFNVLRAAFNDANLAADTSGFSAETLIIAIRSFSSPYWEVRNSACLAYTALVRRMIGFLNIQKRESARRALTGLEFFHRYPALHPFLFSELKIATELLGDESSSPRESNIMKSIHPSLCPILILLSRLKPSLISSVTDDALDPILFMPFIQRCGTQSNFRVRLLASRALIGLVSNEKLRDVLNCVAQRLPRERPLSTKMSGSEAITSSSLSFNAIHGILLQLSSLLDNNCRDLPDATHKDQILGQLIQVLSSCSWIGSNKSCPCPTLNSSYLRVLDQMFGIARTSATSHNISIIQTLLLDLATECLDIERSNGLASHDPTLVELQKQAAASYFGCLFGGNLETAEEGFQLPGFSQGASSNLSQMPVNEISIDGLQERIRSCIFYSSYEVRVGVLKRLFQLVKSIKCGSNKGLISLWAERHLQAVMMSLLPVEENPKCIYYILKIIFSWFILQFETGCSVVDLESTLSFWNRLVLLNKTVTRSKTREVLICCMAVSVKHFVILLRDSILSDQSVMGKFANKKGLVEALSCVSSFVDLVKQHSLASEPVNMRKAASEAIIASGLLSEASQIASVLSYPNSSEVTCIVHIENLKASNLDISDVVNFYAGRILDLWFTCIQLLEDEDDGLRQRLADDVQKCVNFKGSKGSHCNDSVPSQVDRVIELSFKFLSAGFGHWIGYLNYLCGYVSNAAAAVGSQGNLVRRIFDKEIDNHHEEKLLVCQICCTHLETLSRNSQSRFEGSNENSVEIFLQTWRQKFLGQLVSFASDCLESDNVADWIGGIGNHKDAFTSLYANLLGLYALTQNLSVGLLTDSYKVYFAEFVELREIIRPFLRNPLISNMYYLVVKAQEKMFGVSFDPKSREHCSIWEDFEPYFLIR